MSNIYNDLNTIRRQTNSSLSTIIGTNSRNFEGFYKALKGFFDQIYFTETDNSITLNKVYTNSLLRSNGVIEVGQVGQAANITLNSNGNITAQSLNTQITTTDKVRFMPGGNINLIGLPGEMVYVSSPLEDEGMYYYNSQTGWNKVTSISTGDSQSSSYTFSNGLIETNGTVRLGGILDSDTQIDTSIHKLSLLGKVNLLANIMLADEGKITVPLTGPAVSVEGQYVGYGGTLTPGMTFYVAIYGMDGSNNYSAASPELTVTVQPGKDEVDFQWTPNGSAFYHVYIGTASGVYDRFYEVGPTGTYLWLYDYSDQPATDRAEIEPSGTLIYATPHTTPTNAGTSVSLEISKDKIVLPNLVIGQTALETGISLQVDGNIKVSGMISSPRQILTKTTNGFVNWNLNNGYNAEYSIDGPINLRVLNPKPGTYGTLLIRNLNALGEIYLIYGQNYTINNGQSSPPLSQANGAIDILTFYYDGTNFFWNVGHNYTTNQVTE